jgi:DNA-binding MarR family transcriptional regulator
LTPTTQKVLVTEEVQFRRERAIAELLEYFYAVHYQIGMAIEDVLRDGGLSRKQVAILWLISSEGKDNQMRRKEIETALKRWFEVSSSAVSQALRSMSRAPLNLIDISDDPNSGRERLVSLTAAGHDFIAARSARAGIYSTALHASQSTEMLEQAVEYFRLLTIGLESVQVP